MNQDFNNSPIVIGGVGGSGTRVVAQIINELGYYIGNDLNGAFDNLLYTLLFKRPRWFYRHHNDYKTIATGLNLFEKMMLKKDSPSINELIFLQNAIITMARFGHNTVGDGKGKWPLERIETYLKHVSIPLNEEGYIGWGWKEPNSFLLLDSLGRYYEKLKYIHVVRHGFDMAFSSNRQQLYNWSVFYGLPTPRSSDEEPKAALSYWVKANQRVFEIGEKLGRNKFLLLKYEDLCHYPKDSLLTILNFVGISSVDVDFGKLIRIPKITESIGKYKKYDTSNFYYTDVEYVKKLGFVVE